MANNLCENCQSYGIVAESLNNPQENEVIMPCSNCAQDPDVGGGKWMWNGELCYGSMSDGVETCGEDLVKHTIYLFMKCRGLSSQFCKDYLPEELHQLFQELTEELDG